MIPKKIHYCWFNDTPNAAKFAYVYGLVEKSAS